jgi:hypothetical protein
MLDLSVSGRCVGGITLPAVTGGTSELGKRVSVEVGERRVRRKRLGEISGKNAAPLVPQVTGDAAIHPVEGGDPELPHAEVELAGGRDLGVLFEDLTEASLDGQPFRGVLTDDNEDDEEEEKQRSEHKPPEITATAERAERSHLYIYPGKGGHCCQGQYRFQ